MLTWSHVLGRHTPVPCMTYTVEKQRSTAFQKYIRCLLIILSHVYYDLTQTDYAYGKRAHQTVDWVTSQGGYFPNMRQRICTYYIGKYLKVFISRNKEKRREEEGKGKEEKKKKENWTQHT